MKRYFIFLAAIFVIPSILFAWTEPTGSTFTATSSESQEIKDIQNNVHDNTHSAWTVYNISTGPYHDRMWVWDAELSTWVILSVFSPNDDNVSTTTARGVQNISFNYGFNGETWDRLKSDGLHYLWVRSSSDSLTGIYYGNETAIVQHDGELEVETSTDSKVGIYYNGEVAIVQHDGELEVESSTDSTVSIYYNGNKAIVQEDGDLDVRSSTNSYSTIYYEGNKAEVQHDNELRVETSTGSRTTLYYNEEEARIQHDGDLEVESSTDSTTSIYYNGTKAIVDTEGQLQVQSSTDSITQARLYDWNGTAWQTTDIYGLSRSTGQDVTVSRLDSLRRDLYGVSRSTGMDITISRLDSLLTELYGISRSTDIEKIREELYSLARSSGIDLAISELEKLNLGLYGVARSTGIDALIDKVALETDGLYGVARSTGIDAIITRLYQVLVASGSVEVTNFPTDYPDATAQSSLSSIDTNTENTYDQLKTSVTVSDIAYAGKVSTGTAGKIFTSGNISVTNWEMDIYTFYSTGGDSTITSDWAGGTIYALNGIPVAPIRLSRPVTNPTFQCVLAADTTLYYILNGVRKP